MKISTRNIIKGKILKIAVGAVNAEVVIEIAPGVELTGVITKTSLENLKLTEGSDAYALIKATDVMFGID